MHVRACVRMKGSGIITDTPQRGGKMTKSQRAVPSSVVGAVSTVKIEGSAWSKATVLITMNLARSYLRCVVATCIVRAKKLSAVCVCICERGARHELSSRFTNDPVNHTAPSQAQHTCKERSCHATRRHQTETTLAWQKTDLLGTLKRPQTQRLCRHTCGKEKRALVTTKSALSGKRAGVTKYGLGLRPITARTSNQPPFRR